MPDGVKWLGSIYISLRLKVNAGGIMLLIPSTDVTLMLAIITPLYRFMHAFDCYMAVFFQIHI